MEGLFGRKDIRLQAVAIAAVPVVAADLPLSQLKMRWLLMATRCVYRMACAACRNEAGR